MYIDDIFTRLGLPERFKTVAVETVYPGYYRLFCKTKYDQILGEYLDAKRQPGCPAEQAHGP